MCLWLRSFTTLHKHACQALPPTTTLQLQAKTLKFTKVRWQDVQSFLESLEKTDLKDFLKQQNLQTTSREQCKHLEVPTHLQGAGGPGRFLEECYEDQLQHFVHHLGISGASEADSDACEYTILLHWSEVNANLYLRRKCLLLHEAS